MKGSSLIIHVGEIYVYLSDIFHGLLLCSSSLVIAGIRTWCYHLVLQLIDWFKKKEDG